MADYLEQLDRLATLLQKGVLSQEEFETEKARLLAARAEPSQAASSTLASMARRPSVIVTACLIMAGVAGGYWLISGMRPAASTETSTESQVKAQSSQVATFDLVNRQKCRFDPQSESFIERIKLASRSPVADPERLLTIGGESGEQAEVRTRESKEILISEVDISLPWHGGTVRNVRVIDWPQGRGIVLSVAGSVSNPDWSKDSSLNEQDPEEQENLSGRLESKLFTYSEGAKTNFACFATSIEQEEGA